MKFLWFILAGLLGGLLGGMGMGGGTVLIPLLSLFYKVNQHSAQGSNLITFIPMAIVTIIIHAKNGLIKKQGLWKIIITACIFAIGGSLLSQIVEVNLLKRIFGGFLIVLSIVQFFENKIKEKLIKDE